VTALAQLPFEQASLLESAPRLRALQAQGPVHKIRTATGDQAWLVTGYEQVRRMLADPRLGRSHPDPGSAARTGESVLFGGPLGSYQTEDADHAWMRSLLQPHFTSGRMRALRPRVDALTTGLLDELDRHDRPADLVEAVAVPLPVLVICELLGMPYQDRSRFRAGGRSGPRGTPRCRGCCHGGAECPARQGRCSQIRSSGRERRRTRLPRSGDPGGCARRIPAS